MVDALSTALSGLTAQTVRLSAAANNIANANTTGPLPTAAAPASSVYKPLSVSYTALSAGGVQAGITADPNGYIPVYDPSDIFANAEGLIAAPNVDLTKETISIIESKLLYKANVAVIKSEKEMLGDLLNIIK